MLLNWCWRRLLRVPWTARRSNQSTLKEISPECSLEGLMLKLKLQYFGHLMWRTDSLERTWCWERLRAGEGDDRGDGRMASPTQWTWVWASSGSWWGTGKPGMLQSMGLQRVGHDRATELNWTDGFSSSYVWIWELDQEECWEPSAEQNWCFQMFVLEKKVKVKSLSHFWLFATHRL